MKRYPEYKNLSLTRINTEVLDFWKKRDIFKRSISDRDGAPSFVFYEGPPSANGMPGIHHVMARAIKDIFCRYKTQKGFQVLRKSGWDTHGLPIELQVEKSLGITKEDIGKSISVDEYNAACKKDVMKFTSVWEDLTEKMGYWVDLEHPYITYEKKYIETLWYLLKELFKKDLLYKGYTIQPYSPAAGTGLSTHELNQPGTYKNIKDTSAVAQFKILETNYNQLPFTSQSEIFALAWTTTPWTLPSNTALAVGANIQYVAVETYNPYTFEKVCVILAEALLSKYFKLPNGLDAENANGLFVDEESHELAAYNAELHKKSIPWKKIAAFKGSDIVGIRYEQLLPYAQPEEGDAFKIIAGDFVTTADGTGIVHIAPSFGADDFKVARQNGIGYLTLVDKRGKFVPEVTDFANEYVKEAYLTEDQKEVERQKQGRDKYLSVDERISIKLKEQNRAFKVERYEHSYPHCWRTDKPILYYPLDSWFVKTTAAKDRMVELNKTINWKPESTGTGRFGNWLENLVDWNLSRSRYWGTPLPIWSTDDGSERICIGSEAELEAEMVKARAAGMKNPSSIADLHRPYVDEIILVSPSGKPMKRELDLIDVWFDSGAMPYAQHGLENMDMWKTQFPADFIAEGVDQTRGWFFTLHAISVLLFDSVAYKNVVSNGLVLDKDGNKMSKRLGNAVDPFITLDKYGADATRWYMVSNAQPWDNLKFDLDGIEEVQRKFFGTLYNTYAFFALYSNIDHFTYSEAEIPVAERPEIDRWIISLLNSLVKKVNAAYSDYDPTTAARAIQQFTDEHLSNWYVRLCRRRFWKGEYTADKIAAYQTLYVCMQTLSQLMAPIAPFFSEQLFKDLNDTTGKIATESVHLALMPDADESLIDTALEERMQMAQTISSLTLSLRKKSNIKVRQPLERILIPVFDDATKEKIKLVESLILAEVNIKHIEYVEDASNVVTKKIKANFKSLGPKHGKYMKEIAVLVQEFNQAQIFEIERTKHFDLKMGDGTTLNLSIEDVDILSDDMPGWLVASEDRLTVALDVNISDELKHEGIAREFVNRIQRLRKERDFEVTNKINIVVENNSYTNDALNAFKNYICAEVLALSLEIGILENEKDEVSVIEVDEVKISVSVKIN